MSENNLIYGLRDPRNDVYRYVGKTTIGYGRPLQHLIRSHNELVNAWVSELSHIGMVPFVDVLEENIDLADLSTRELYYISKYSDVGIPLFNGGESRVKAIAGGVVDIDESKSIFISLINSASIVAAVKLKMCLSDVALGNIIDVGRTTLSRLKNGQMSTRMDSVIKLHILNIYGFQDMFDYYYSISHEWKGNYPDDIASFIVAMTSDHEFTKKVASKYFRHKIKLFTNEKPKEKRFKKLYKSNITAKSVT